MEQLTKHTNTYRQKLLSKKKELTQYLKAETQLGIKINVEHDKRLGYFYQLSISLDNRKFVTHSTIKVDSANKHTILNELKEHISRFSAFEKRLAYEARRRNSETSKLYCYLCESEKPENKFHRNIDSDNTQDGYSHVCLDCAYKQAISIMEVGNIKTALTFLCCVFNKPYFQHLANEILQMDIPDVEKLSLYYKRLNLTQQFKSGKRTFAYSDIFE